MIQNDTEFSAHTTEKATMQKLNKAMWREYWNIYNTAMGIIFLGKLTLLEN
jgi:hypothetical protein